MFIQELEQFASGSGNKCLSSYGVCVHACKTRRPHCFLRSPPSDARLDLLRCRQRRRHHRSGQVRCIIFFICLFKIYHGSLAAFVRCLVYLPGNKAERLKKGMRATRPPSRIDGSRRAADPDARGEGGRSSGSQALHFLLTRRLQKQQQTDKTARFWKSMNTRNLPRAAISPLAEALNLNL